MTTTNASTFRHLRADLRGRTATLYGRNTGDKTWTKIGGGFDRSELRAVAERYEAVGIHARQMVTRVEWFITQHDFTGEWETSPSKRF